jgi:hypothetical protein
MSFWGVVTTRSQATPCFSATTRNIAWMNAAIELIVNEMETPSAAMPSNASSMSRSESTAMPTRPTSPAARGSSESSPSWVGRSNATLSAS